MNGVAPGPIWTPLNPSGGQPPEEIPEFGKDTPMGRPGQPNEVAPGIPVPGLRGFELHDRAGPASRRRRHDLELESRRLGEFSQLAALSPADLDYLAQSASLKNNDILQLARSLH